MARSQGARQSADQLRPSPLSAALPVVNPGEHILLIDDDPDVLGSLERALVAAGYVVHPTSGSLAGIRYYEAHWQEIKVVMLDFFLPVLRGDEVFERLRTINPSVCVILMTGCDNEVAKQMFDKGLHSFLQKPFLGQDLIAQVQHAIRSPDQPQLVAPQPLSASSGPAVAEA